MLCLISAVQQSDSVIHIYILFPNRQMHYNRQVLINGSVLSERQL